MFENNKTNLRNLDDKAKIFQQLQNLIKEYNLRKSKFIKFVPTEKELKEAMRFYNTILRADEEKDPSGKKIKEILDSISEIPEEQIKFTGFMNEILSKYPNGEIPHDTLMDAAEKWDVLEYIVEDIKRVLGLKLR